MDKKPSKPGLIETLGSIPERLIRGAQNIAGKIVALVGTGIVAYIALSVLSAIALFFLKIALAFAISYAVCTDPHFANFRYHFNGLVIAPVRAFMYNKLLLPVMNGVIDSWNNFWTPQSARAAFNAAGDHLKGSGKDADTEVKKDLGFVFRILQGIGNALISFKDSTVDYLCGKLGGVEKLPETTADYYRRYEAGRPGRFLIPSDAYLSSDSLVGGFAVGLAKWSYETSTTLINMIWKAWKAETAKENSASASVVITAAHKESDTTKAMTFRNPPTDPAGQKKITPHN